MECIPRTLGQTLHALRKAQGWSQETTAEQLGMSQQNYSQYENDDIVEVPLSKLQKFSTVFRVPLDALIAVLLLKDNAHEKEAKTHA